MKYTPEIQEYFKNNWDKCPFINALSGNNGDIPTDLTCGVFDLVIKHIEDELQLRSGDKYKFLDRDDALIITHENYGHFFNNLCNYKDKKIKKIEIICPDISREYFIKPAASSLGNSVVYVYFLFKKENNLDMHCIRFTR